MSSEAILLALSTVIRPTTVAALFAILAHTHPHRLLVAYIVGGLAFSITVGAMIVVLLRGVGLASSSTMSRPVLDIVLGGAALDTPVRCGPDGSPVEVARRVRRRRRGGCIAICATSRFAVLRRRVCSPTSRG